MSVAHISIKPYQGYSSFTVLKLLSRREFSSPEPSPSEDGGSSIDGASSSKLLSISTFSAASPSENSEDSRPSPLPAAASFLPVSPIEATICEVEPGPSQPQPALGRRPLQSVVCIEFVPEDSKPGLQLQPTHWGSWPSTSNYLVTSCNTDACTAPSHHSHLDSSALNASQNYKRVIVKAPSPLWKDNPTVSFNFSEILPIPDHYSFFCVFVDDQHVHSEVTDLIQLPKPLSTGHQLATSYVYSTKLIPKYWEELCKTYG